MQEEAGNAEGAYRAAVFIDVVFIVVDIPVDGGICYHVDPGIVQGGDVHEYYGGAVGLYGSACEEVVIVLEEQFNRYLFVSIVACQVNAYQGYEADFRMGFQKRKYAFLAKFTGGDVVK